MFKRLFSTVVCIAFFVNSLQYASAQDFSVNQLPVPGSMVNVSKPFIPLSLKGLIVNPQKPLEFQFLVDTGKGPQDTASIKDAAGELVKYFLAGLTIPEGDLWVNLSPYEKDRIVPEALGQTNLGRDLLAQDYMLKQLTASLIYPEKDLGKAFWNKVYAQAQAQFGTTNIPVNTFNKVWILPDQVQVYQHHNAVYVTKATLKVMLDEDYMSLKNHVTETVSSPNASVGDLAKAHALGSQIVRSIILPAITKEVNEGSNFAPLRQIYQAMILAKWYKESIQNRLLDTVYTDKNKIVGINVADPGVKEQIYQRYIQAYRKGVFNYIKDTPDANGQSIPRKYFSGGVLLKVSDINNAAHLSDVHVDGAMVSVWVMVGAAVALALTAIGTRNYIVTDKKESEIIDNLLKSPFVSDRVIAINRGSEKYSYKIVPRVVKLPELSHLEAKILVMIMAGNLSSILKLPADEANPYLEFLTRMAQNNFTDISIYSQEALGVAVRRGVIKLEAIPDVAGLRAKVSLYAEDSNGLNILIRKINGKHNSFRAIFPVFYFALNSPSAVKFLLKHFYLFDDPNANTLTLEYLLQLARDVIVLHKSREVFDKVKSLPKLNKDYLNNIVQNILGLESKIWPSSPGGSFGGGTTPLTKSVVARSPNVDAATVAEPGGIDLNPINFNHTGRSIDVAYDPAQLALITQNGFKGFQSVITRINFVADPVALLQA